MNEVLLGIEIVVMFSALLAFKKFFGKEGLFLWIGLAAVLANVQVAKTTELFGVAATGGNVLFASVFLATDLLRESYGKEAAKKGVFIGVASVVFFLLSTQLAMLYKPHTIDTAHQAMVNLFALSPRVCAASLLMFAVANYLDVVIYDRLHKTFDGKALWLRNNIATVSCNCLENFGFVFIAFGGVYPTTEVLTIAGSTCIIEVVIALCDTPFLYAGKKM